MDNIHLKPNAKISPFLEDVIKEIARKHPDWVIASGAPEEARRFTVYYKGDTSRALGDINEDYKYTNGERRRLFVIDNWRIAEVRQRGSGVQTSKPKEALKAVDKYFYPLTDKEYIDMAFKHAHHLIYAHAAETRGTVEASIRRMHQPMMTFAHKHWDKFLDSLDVKEKEQALDLLKHQQLSNAAKALYKDVDDRKSLTVFLSDGKYTVQQGEVMQDYESDTLPEFIKVKVGLLKLVEEKDVVPEVGVRVGNVYVIRP